MSSLRFVRPAGVVLLSNVVSWMKHRDCRVTFAGTSTSAGWSRPEGVTYLDNAHFFRLHQGAPLSPAAKSYRSMQPLRLISNNDVHAWLENNLIPWLASILRVNTATLADYKVCISELFNNIHDHSANEIGSILVQHFGAENTVRIAIADWGVGIPATVRRVEPEIVGHGDAIVRAVQPGFTSKSWPRNQGAGLAHLLDKVVGSNRGSVLIMSSNGTVRFEPAGEGGTGWSSVPLSDAGFCPGTVVEIHLRTDTIEHVPESREDMEWP